MDKVLFTAEELKEIVDMSVEDEGMRDMLEKMKTYYFLKRLPIEEFDRDSTLRTSSCYVGRISGITYSNTSPKTARIIISVSSKVDQYVNVKVNDCVVSSHYIMHNTVLV